MGGLLGLNLILKGNDIHICIEPETSEMIQSKIE
jgi:hypothetical protein